MKIVWLAAVAAAAVACADGFGAIAAGSLRAKAYDGVSAAQRSSVAGGLEASNAVDCIPGVKSGDPCGWNCLCREGLHCHYFTGCQPMADTPFVTQDTLNSLPNRGNITG